MEATESVYTTTSATRHRVRQREQQQQHFDLPPSSERQAVYERRVYAVTCQVCGDLGEVQGAAAVGAVLRLHARTCRGDAYGEPTGKVGTL